MRNATVSLFSFFLILTVNLLAPAQDTKPAEQKSEKPAAADTEKPKNEVEEMLAEISKRGDKVLAACIDPAHCGEESSDRTLNGQKLNLEKGSVVHLAVPAYSPLARAAHVQGVVKVQAIIDEDGKVIAAAAISGHPLLQAACVRAARDSVFTPTKLEGVPVKVTGVIQYNFVAQ